jgi:acyl-CoA thioester hydrolase
MPSFDPARLDAANYAHQVSVETRFQDLDPLGHINNVALAGIFENGRVRFNRDLTASHQSLQTGDRWLVARVEVNYLAEAHYPEPILITNAIGHIGNRSWQILSAAWQGGQVVGLCDATLVYQSASGQSSLTPEMRSELEALRIKA